MTLDQATYNELMLRLQTLLEMESKKEIKEGIEELQQHIYWANVT